MADALHAHGFNFLQATNYLWPNVTPWATHLRLPFTIYYLCRSTLGQTLRWVTCRSLCHQMQWLALLILLHQMLSNNLKIWPNLAATNFALTAAQCQGSLAECSMAERPAKPEDVATARQHWHIHHFRAWRQNPGSHPASTIQQETAAVAASPRQLLVTCHVAWLLPVREHGGAQDEAKKQAWLYPFGFLFSQLKVFGSKGRTLNAALAQQ